MPGQYQVALLGKDEGRFSRLRNGVTDALHDLGIEPTAVVFLKEQNVASRDMRQPTMAVFFGSKLHNTDTLPIANLILDSVIIVPVLRTGENIKDNIPPQLQHVNALFCNSDLHRLISIILETFNLLRKERKLFISYKRDDSQAVANNLYDAFDAGGFDVFIDIRSVPPAANFQSILWHRMSDADIVVLIDTENFRKSRWTVAELAQANATNIQILHLLWPGQLEDQSSSFSHFYSLGADDFVGGRTGAEAVLTLDARAKIVEEAERLRSRALAARYRYLVDNFCDAARDLGLDPTVQPQRWIAVGDELSVVPAIGVPTADRIQNLFEALEAKSETTNTWIIYDHRGVLREWLAHLDWLDVHLPVRTVQMASAPLLLEELGK